MWNRVWKWICKEGVVIRKMNKWLCCFNLKLGVQIIILYSVIFFLSLSSVTTYQLIYIKDSRVDCSAKLVFDIYCLLFGGHVGMFSTIYVSLYFITTGTVGFFGIYWWVYRFRLQLIERFFVTYFVVTLLTYINGICLGFITNDLSLQLIINFLITTFINFYWISIVYSFTLQKEREYRTQRKRYTDVIAECEGADCEDDSLHEKINQTKSVISEESNSKIVGKEFES